MNKNLIIISLSGIFFLSGLVLIFLTIFLNLKNGLVTKLAISGCVLTISGFLTLLSTLIFFKEGNIEFNNLDDSFNSNDEIDIEHFIINQENSINQEIKSYQNIDIY